MESKAAAIKDEPIPDLVRQLSADMSLLIRQEMKLARAEFTDKGKKAAKSAGFFGTSALFGLAAFGALTITIVAALSLLVPVWVAALIVTVVYGAVAAGAALIGKSSLENVGAPIPEQTVRSVKADIDEIHDGIQRAR
jgi:hypothetical protein